ncbi:MAG: PEP-CTERM sorting domain-containing protein, partial [Pseudomonadota bacterium]
DGAEDRTEPLRLTAGNPKVGVAAGGTGVGFFSGGSTPEPETLAGLAIAALAWIAALLRRRSRLRSLRGRLIGGTA